MTKLKTRLAVGLVAAIGVGAMATAIATAGASTGHATATTTTTTTTLAPPVQGNGPHHVFFNVDTVQGAGGTVKLAADAACSMTNLFQRGDVVVFRMYGVHVTSGGNNLTNVTVKSAFVKVPGLKAIPLVYSTHPDQACGVVLDSGVAGRPVIPARGRELLRHSRHQSRSGRADGGNPV